MYHSIHNYFVLFLNLLLIYQEMQNVNYLKKNYIAIHFYFSRNLDIIHEEETNSMYVMHRISLHTNIGFSIVSISI